MSFSPGENVGPYTIIEQLGQGGMATVYKAYHAALDRNVAIKALHSVFTQDPQFTQRFQREARVVAKLEHPNIVPVYDYADHQGQSYLVMKFIEGQTLKALLDRGWPSKREILRIVMAVGGALTYAHGKGVLHRDVKPSNILLTDEGGVFLADFGLARMAEAGQSTLSGDQLLGTPHYISPEQARGEQDLDAGTDIYSLGIVLYQLSVGQVPFNSDTPFSIIHDHIYTPLPLPRQLNQKIPEELERVLLKGLAKDRADRFATVEQQVQAFERAVSGGSAWQAGAAGAAAMPAPDDRVAAAAAAPEVVVGPDDQVAAAAAAPEVVPGPDDQVAAAAAAPEVVSGLAAGAGPLTRRWPWVVGGLGLSAACLLAFALAMDGALSGSAAGSAGLLEQLGDSQIDSPADSPGPQPDGAGPGQVPVIDQSDDGWAHMQRADQLAGDGMIDEAVQEYTESAELFLAAADYAAAAEAATRALEVSGGTPDGDPRLANLLAQALFLGAEGLDMLPALDRVQALAPDWPPLQVLRARSLLFMGEPDQAQSMVEQALGRAPGDPLANAVMVDLQLAADELERAREIAQKLLAEGRMPPWLREHLQTQLREM